MVIRVLAVPDYLDLASFDEVFCGLLGWDGLGFSFHGAEWMEAELGEERQPNPVKPEAAPDLPLPDGPITVGLDGGYVRAAHQQGCFEVIAGPSVVAFRRREEDAGPPPKCFGFVQTYDPKPRRRPVSFSY